MPVIGFGTYLFKSNDIVDVLKSAILDHGYRHIDTAAKYENEESIGKSL